MIIYYLKVLELRKYKCLVCKNFRVVENLGVELIQYCTTYEGEVTYEDKRDCNTRSKMQDKDWVDMWEEIEVKTKLLMKYGF